MTASWISSSLSHESRSRPLWRSARCALVLLAAMSPRPAAAQEFHAAIQIDLPIGSTPRSVAIGDLNGDGYPDLATANFSSDKVSVLLGNGAGEFGPETEFRTGDEPSSVAIGDVSGDGKPDLVVANSRVGTVSVLLGNGVGGFAPRTDFATGVLPFSVAIGDLNGDGKPDLATANSRFSTVSVLLGNGAGGFGARTDYPTGPGRSVAIGDVNGDGNPDLVTANLSSTVSVLLGNGMGGFGAKTDFATGLRPISVAIGDLNGDGRPDLATANSGSNTASVLLGDGAGAFGPRTDFATGEIPQSVAIGDVSRDGKPDLVVANSSSDTVSLLLGDGAGGFGVKTDFEAGNGPVSVAIGDVNGDGMPDLVVADYAGDTVSVLLGIIDGPVPTLLALADYDVQSGRVTLRWQASDAVSLQATVERSVEGGAWTTLGSPRIEGTDLLVYEDESVTPGCYWYRIRYVQGSTEQFSDPVRVEVPAVASLALEGFRPNPALETAAISFSLPDARPASLQIHDVRGRIVFTREVGGLGPGTHLLRLDGSGRLAPGIYWIRLVRSEGVLTAKGIVVR